MKRACVLRWGAYGDHIICSGLYPVLKADGYHVTVHSSERGMQIIKHNPYIDKVIPYVSDSVPAEEIDKYLEDLSKNYDKFINLSGSIEGTLAIPDTDVEKMGWSKEKRRRECNHNYYDRMFEIAGYDIKGRNGELYFSDFEESLARQFRKKYKNKFLILWVLSGSSMHKAYPYAQYVAIKFLNEHSDAMTLTVGEELCRILEWEHPRAKCYSGNRTIRDALILTKYVDLVIGVDTGVMNGAGCFPTPKIVLLSALSEENLCKYWENCIPLHANVECYPCHMLHYNLGSCLLDEQVGTPICMSKLSARQVYNSIEKVYVEWKNGNKRI